MAERLRTFTVLLGSLMRTFSFIVKTEYMGDGEMAQWVKSLATKPEA